MGLHRLTSITLGVPDVAASTAFFHDFGLTGDASGLATRDGGEQVELVPSAGRRSWFGSVSAPTTSTTSAGSPPGSSAPASARSSS